MTTEPSSARPSKPFSTTILERFEEQGITGFEQVPDHQEELEGKDQERFERLKDSLLAVFARKSEKAICDAANLSRRQLERLFNNVLEDAGSDGQIRGLSAFVNRSAKKTQAVEGEARAARTFIAEICPQHLRDVAVWTPYDCSGLSPAKKTRFDALVAATETLFAGGTPEQVANKAGVSWGQYKRLFKSAMKIERGTRQIRGLKAFASHESQEKRVRTAPDRPGSSSMGLFGKLLRDYPIAQKMTEWLKSQKRPNKIKPKTLRSKFKEIIHSETGSVKVPADAYPHTKKYAVRRPLQVWYEQEFIPMNSRRYVQMEMGESAGKVLGFAEGDGQTYLLPEAYDTWQIDEYTADVFLRFVMPSIFGGWDEIDLPRLAVIVVRECALGAVLAWRLVLSKQASAEDISLVMRDAVMGQAKARRVIEGLDYNEGAGYPAVIFDLLRWKAPRLVMLDNALSHLADTVHNIVLRVFSAKFDLGQSATPKTRAAVESEVMQMALSFVQQLPFTSGRDPKDPVRSSSQRPTGKVDVPRFQHGLDCYLANRNGVAREAPGQISVLERTRRVIESNQLGAVIPILGHKRKPHFFSMPVERPVKYNMDARKPRSPHINFDSVRYSNLKVLDKNNVKGLWLRIYPNYDNLQTVEAYRLDNTYLGTLVAEKKWAMSPHDSRTRKLYLHYKALGELEDNAADPPLRALYLCLSKKAHNDKAAAAALAHVVYYLERTLDPARRRQLEAEVITERIDEAAANADSIDALLAAAETFDDDDEGDESDQDAPPIVAEGAPPSLRNVVPFGPKPPYAASAAPQAEPSHASTTAGRVPPSVKTEDEDDDDDFDFDMQATFRIPTSI
jgi:hypothetical protein